MAKYNIPTAAYGVFTEPEAAKEFAAKIGVPIVVKADGLAAGKGVLICENLAEAEQAIEDILVDNKFGSAGLSCCYRREFLDGQEVSVLAFADGEHIVPMVSAQDHKRIFDNDKGLNTGGMGLFASADLYRRGARDCRKRSFGEDFGGDESRGTSVQRCFVCRADAHG